MKQKYTPMRNLKVMRAKRGVTLKVLADKAGVNYNTIIAYEKGYHSPRTDNLFRIAKVLDCEVTDLISQED